MCFENLTLPKGSWLQAYRKLHGEARLKVLKLSFTLAVGIVGVRNIVNHISLSEIVQVNPLKLPES